MKTLAQSPPVLQTHALALVSQLVLHTRTAAAATGLLFLRGRALSLRACSHRRHGAAVPTREGAGFVPRLLMEELVTESVLPG